MYIRDSGIETRYVYESVACKQLAMYIDASNVEICNAYNSNRRTKQQSMLRRQTYELAMNIKQSDVQHSNAYNRVRLQLISIIYFREEILSNIYVFTANLKFTTLVFFVSISVVTLTIPQKYFFIVISQRRHNIQRQRSIYLEILRIFYVPLFLS